MSGYVNIHRSVVGHAAFRNEAEGMAFVWMVIKAAWKPATVRYKGRSIKLGRGQLAISQRDMATAFGYDKSWIERLWKRLKSEAMIEAHSEAGVAVITICNYDTFQLGQPWCEAPTEAPAKAVNEAVVRQPRGTEQEREEVNKGMSNDIQRAKRLWGSPPFAGTHTQTWKDFLANRRAKRQPNTLSAWKKLNDDLERISRETGWTPEALLEHATAKGWGGIYNPTGRDQKNGTGTEGSSNQRAAATALANIRGQRSGAQPATGSR